MAENSDADEALMLRFAGGDVLAFETLYRRHELKVWRYFYRSVSNQATADDLLQEVWMAVSQAARRYQPSALYDLVVHFGAPSAGGRLSQSQAVAKSGCRSR